MTIAAMMSASQQHFPGCLERQRRQGRALEPVCQICIISCPQFSAQNLSLIHDDEIRPARMLTAGNDIQNLVRPDHQTGFFQTFPLRRESRILPGIHEARWQ